MAVYRRNYKRFEGELTDSRWRFTILPRFAFQSVFESRLLTSFFSLCMLPHVVGVVLIYLRSNASALQALNLNFLQYLQIDASFFTNILAVETYLSFLLVTFIGPNLVAPDLANNALLLYLSRPFSKMEYIIGKLSVLAIVTSLVTWIPALIVIAIQVDQAGLSWLRENYRIPLGIVVGSWIWIITISLMAVALSAWVKMRPTAIFSLFGVFFVAATFGNIANSILDLQPPWGILMDLNAVMSGMWHWLLQGESHFGFVMRRGRVSGQSLPSWSALVSLVTFSGISLLLLVKKIRACEIVR